MRDYIRDGAEIYRRSFATIRAEADLDRFDADTAPIVVRMIHACGLVELAGDVQHSPGVVAAARAALRTGAPILCDAQMVTASAWPCAMSRRKAAGRGWPRASPADDFRPRTRSCAR